jgi:hypothetical protein
MPKIQALRFLVTLLSLALPVSMAATEEITLCSQEGNLYFNLALPPFELEDLENGETRIRMDGAAYSGRPGYPRLPMFSYTFALPPGSEVKDVEVTGSRYMITGEHLIEANLPPLPMSGSKDIADMLYSLYEENRARVYSGEEILSPKLGKLHSASERREYSLATVSVYPFYHDPVSGKLSVASNVTIRIGYAPVDPKHACFISRFMDAGTIYKDVPEQVYNKDQARAWYRPQARLLDTPGMIILSTEEFEPYTEDYVSWRESTGFNVMVVTKEEILESAEGVDDPQRIRNWLREHAADYHYLFIIGHYWHIPMRILSTFSADPFQDYNYYPHPSDIYYADLSKPDAESWDIDGDGLYGEVEEYYGGDSTVDEPDLEAELHVGRINTLKMDNVDKILERTWLFEASKDITYKKSSVMAGGILWYWSNNDKMDGAYIMEYLLDEKVLNRSLTTTLYEKEGDNPSSYDCDLPFTNDNLVSALANNNVGVFVEFNHGSLARFARCVWYDDNGDNNPQDGELDWPPGLFSSDAPDLNQSYPNVAFLMSCLNGKPEPNPCLAQALLNHGSVGVIAHTRVSWSSFWQDPGDSGMEDLFYYDLEAYLKDENTHDYVIGDAISASRVKCYNEAPWEFNCLNIYGHVLYGDPALRHMGREGIIPGVEEIIPRNTPAALGIDADYNIRFSLPAAGKVQLEVWDVAGRRVETLLDGNANAGAQTIKWNTAELPCGSYFVTLRTGNITRSAKAVVIH